jgi:hypothetical protein
VAAVATVLAADTGVPHTGAGPFQQFTAL